MANVALRRFLRGILPGPLRETYHRRALRRDFGIETRTGERRPSPIDPTLPRGVNVVGYLGSATGVGRSARAIARAAEASGLPVSTIEAAGLENGFRGDAPYVLNLFHVNADAAASVVELCGPRVHRGHANVGYWYWETEEFPRRWRDRFAYFDEIWVASEFCRRAIAGESPIPVALVPPPVVVEGSPGPVVRGDEAPFRFLTVADADSFVERKNPLGVVRAFARAFGDDRSVALTVRLANAGSQPAVLDSLRAAAGDSAVVLDTDPAAPQRVAKLLAECDAYVSLHRAEGFGLPIAEAMSLGKPVVTTDWSGSADFVDETTGFPVRWRPVALDRAVGPYPAGSRWAEPDEEHAAETMRRIVRDPPERGRRADAGRRRIESRYGLEAAARRVRERLESLLERLGARR